MSMRGFGVVGYSLSVSDLMLIDGFADVYSAKNEEAILSFLQQNGMDTNLEINLVDPIQHRNLRGMIVEDMRYEGFERSDKDWLKNGCPSDKMIQHIYGRV